MAQVSELADQRCLGCNAHRVTSQLLTIGKQPDARAVIPGDHVAPALLDDWAREGRDESAEADSVAATGITVHLDAAIAVAGEGDARAAGNRSKSDSISAKSIVGATAGKHNALEPIGADPVVFEQVGVCADDQDSENAIAHGFCSAHKCWPQSGVISTNNHVFDCFQNDPDFFEVVSGNVGNLRSIGAGGEMKADR